MAAPPSAATRRLTQCVYVDVPPSPYTVAPASPHRNTATTSRLVSLTFKENTSSLRPFHVGVSCSSHIPAMKRKTSKNELSSAKAIHAKKPKISEEFEAHATQRPADATANACPEFPDASIHCTSVKTVKGVEKKCNIKLCDRCLKKRYGEDPKKIRIVGNDAFIKPSAMEQSFFSLSPKMTNRTVEVLITTTPSKGLYSTIFNTTVKATNTKLELTAVNTSSQRKSGAKSKQQTLQQMSPQSLPELKWTEIPTHLSLDDVKSRLEIREFVLRFASVMEPSIPRTQLAELDDLGCGSDDNEMAPWCIKSVVRDIRATGNNLNKIWPILTRLQNATDDVTQLSFPDPLPLPSVIVYNTRTTRRTSEANGGSHAFVGHTAQMIPVIEALIEAALMTSIVREELDNGLKEAKEVTREVQKAIREENERWDAERKSFEPPKETSEEALRSISKVQGEQIKVKRELHKMRIRDLENALRLVTPVFAPRFSPLGIDKAGRVYWASSPGVLERKAALDFITLTTVSKKGKTHVVNDSSAPREWPWFVAVWGKKILTAGIDLDTVEHGNERWWAFTDPVEIRKVADWIRIDGAIDPNSDADAKKPLASLVKGLNEYAKLLDWRLKEDKYGSVAV
ncbi:hypothetical protein C0992_005951 [Termitomyces sp. T32_za158]|nr:hypothetical protein C0992_005951 [Termitomyces sp. T32_za158]